MWITARELRLYEHEFVLGRGTDKAGGTRTRAVPMTTNPEDGGFALFFVSVIRSPKPSCNPTHLLASDPMHN